MKVRTLAYISRLLEENEKRLCAQQKAAYELGLMDLYNALYPKYQEAFRVRQEFESQQW